MKHHFNKKFFFKRILFFIAALAVISFIVMLLWNWLMPVIFRLPAISFLQALGLLILSKALFLRHSPRPHSKDREFWKKKFEDMHSAKEMAQSEGNAE